MALLEVKDLQVFYGVIQALKGISFTVEEGEIVTLIGANGAGKSTTLNTISGLLRPRSGMISFEGKSIAGIGASRIVGLGMAVITFAIGFWAFRKHERNFILHI